MTFKGQIISDEQANRMLSLTSASQLNWGYPSYEKFYAFMETIPEEERAVIIRALATYQREQHHENLKKKMLNVLDNLKGINNPTED